MIEQQVNALMAAMHEQTLAQKEQTAAINRLAESNEALVAMLYQEFASDIETTSLDSSHPTYLSGKPGR